MLELFGLDLTGGLAWWALFLFLVGAVDMAWSDPATATGSGGLDFPAGARLTEALLDRLASDLLRLGGADGYNDIGGIGFKNVSVAASVAANALTVTIQGRLATLSTSNRARFGFRNATLTTPALTFVESSADIAIVVPDTATLGMANGVPARIYVGVTNDGGTLRGLLYNTQGTNQLHPLPSEAGLHSATAIGTGSDSAGVLYGSAATTSKALVWVGYIEITEATTGTWATDATVEQTRIPGGLWSGAVVQSPTSLTGALATGIITLPYDDTIPQNTEGDQYLSQAITPTSAINRLEITALLNLTNNAAGGTNGTVALFQDSTADALRANQFRMGDDVPSAGPVELFHEMRAATTIETTFKVRVGAANASTTTLNGAAGGRKYGGVMGSYLRIVERFA